MASKKILVTGANGQLGNEFRELENQYPQYQYLFVDYEELRIEDDVAVTKYFQTHEPFACVNCAAYTAVDKAETEKDKSALTNAAAVGILANACHQFNTLFIHISTDYVFDGNSSIPYNEESVTNPVNHYGLTKLLGEQLALQKNPNTIIIRTAWVYSSFGNNFVKTMMRLMKERDSINVVQDQVGSPTYAADLAEAIMRILTMVDDRSTAIKYGIFHYSNEGTISWYEFAVAIKELTGSPCKVNPVPTSQYPTPAKRPQYSLLDKSKIKAAYGVKIPGWRTSLVRCMERLHPIGEKPTPN
jgi:dTDP-4-dehydrorhamnose reductase